MYIYIYGKFSRLGSLFGSPIEYGTNKIERTLKGTLIQTTPGMPTAAPSLVPTCHRHCALCR